MATYFPTTSPAPPCQARAVLQITWDMDLLTRNAELCWMTPAKLPTKFKLCTTSKSKTSLKKKIKKEGKKKKKTSAENEVWGLFVLFFSFFLLWKGVWGKSPASEVHNSKLPTWRDCRGETLVCCIAPLSLLPPPSPLPRTPCRVRIQWNWFVFIDILQG